MIPAMKRLLCGLMMVLILSSRLTAATLDLTEQENGKDIRMDRGDYLVIHLTANPSTGYDWSYAVTGSRLLVQEGEVLRGSKAEGSGMVGAPMTEVWTLKAIRSGCCTITFSYARPWQKGESPFSRLSWPVTIRLSKK